MGFAQQSGYTPLSIETMMLSVMENVNIQFGLEYTVETFLGTNFYKYFYALIQELQVNEIKTSEIFLKLQDYFAVTNERISRPVVTNPGLVEALETAGFIASVKKPIDADAGKVFVAVNVDNLAVDYAAKKLIINTLIKDSTVAGIVSQGTESSTITLTNGQSFDFKYNLPNRLTTLLRLTITTSDNNQVLISSPEDIKELLLENIAESYRLGLNFEPQRYFTVLDAPWAESILLEWSINAGANYYSTVRVANYDDLLEVSLADTTLIES